MSKFLYLFLKFAAFQYLTSRDLLNFNSAGVMFTCVFCCIEFMGQWVLGFDIQDYVPRTREATATFNLNLINLLFMPDLPEVI